MPTSNRLALAVSTILFLLALLIASESKTTSRKSSSPKPVSPTVQFVVDSARVQELARQLASVKGDSLREYWRGYWRKRVPKPDTIETTSTEIDTVEVLAKSDDDLFRESILANETCSIALDSNRSALATTTYDLEEAVSTLNSCEGSRKWYAIGGGLMGFGLGALIR